MNRNLKLCLSLVIVTLLIPLTIVPMGLPTIEWPMFWQVRTYLVNYSGIVSMILMSLCVILSIKHWPLEGGLKGLDKQYRLHKYIGISTVFTALFHWLTFLSDDFAMDMGYVAPKDETFPFWTLIESLGDPAQLIGEYGFYLSTAFVLIAWIKKFKHNVFQMTHKVFPYLYLFLVLHMVMFFDASRWLTVPGTILAATSAIATVACLMTILGYNGKKNRHTATIQGIEPLANGIELTLETNSNTFTYLPGQFAFVGFGDKERPHPFSLASPSKNNGSVRLLIKANGDYTNSLINKLKVGQVAEIEGPYGCFNFRDDAKKQVWIAAGIGIAPFLTAIEEVGSGKQVELYYSYRDTDLDLLTELKKRAQTAGVKLHLRDTREEERFNLVELTEALKHPLKSSVWFCGPSKLGAEIEKEFVKLGLPPRHFHRELFEFR